MFEVGITPDVVAAKVQNAEKDKKPRAQWFSTIDAICPTFCLKLGYCDENNSFVKIKIVKFGGGLEFLDRKICLSHSSWTIATYSRQTEMVHLGRENVTKIIIMATWTLALGEWYTITRLLTPPSGIIPNNIVRKRSYLPLNVRLGIPIFLGPSQGQVQSSRWLENSPDDVAQRAAKSTDSQQQISNSYKTIRSNLRSSQQ